MAASKSSRTEERKERLRQRFQFAQETSGGALFVLQLMTAFLQPLSPLGGATGEGRMGGLSQIPRGVIEIQHLVLGMLLQQRPVLGRPIGNSQAIRVRIQGFYMGNLVFHPGDKMGLTLFWGCSDIGGMLSFSVAIIQTEGAHHGLPRPLVTQEHASSIHAEADRFDGDG